MTNLELALSQVSISALQGKIKRYELVELGGTAGIPNGSTGQIFFTDQAQLRNQADQIIIITNIEVFPVSVQGASQFNPAIAGFPVTEVPKATLNLYIGNELSVHLIPLAKLIHVNDFLSPSQFWMEGFDKLSEVSWDKSFVQFNAATAGGPYVIPFGVSYLRFKRDPSNPANFKEM